MVQVPIGVVLCIPPFNYAGKDCTAYCYQALYTAGAALSAGMTPIIHMQRAAEMSIRPGPTQRTHHAVVLQ